MGGVLTKIEREVRENYTQNLTLKELSRKYYINSAYLGQIFRKKVRRLLQGIISTNTASSAAAELLLHTDKKVMEIAGAVGYRDPDYFINRFIASRGCTPARFRKQGEGPRRVSQKRRGPGQIMACVQAAIVCPVLFYGFSSEKSVNNL